MLSPSRRFGLTANGQAMAVVHESISRPSALAKVFAGDNLPCTFQKRRKNLEENVAALGITLTSEDLKRIDEAAPKGAASGERYEDMSGVNR